jgi:uncharacterized RDD family membrane protein YckC
MEESASRPAPDSASPLPAKAVSPAPNPLGPVSAVTEDSSALTPPSKESPAKDHRVIVAEQVIAIPWAEAIEEGEEEIEEIADGLWRVEASLLDALLSLGVAFAALVLTTAIKETPTINQLGTVAGLALAGVFVLNEYVLIPLGGQSVGMKLVGIRLVRDTGQAARPARCLVRNTVGYLLSALPLGLGFFWIFLDALHQGWHDKITRTMVVKVRRHGQIAYQNTGQATVRG